MIYLLLAFVNALAAHHAYAHGEPYYLSAILAGVLFTIGLAEVK
jgi:hypothetical protein